MSEISYEKIKEAIISYDPITLRNVYLSDPLESRKCFNHFAEKSPELFKDKVFINNYLLQAAKNRQYGIMLDLLSHGANLNIANEHTETPLLNFMMNDKIPSEHPFSKETATIDCMYSLIEQGAKIDGTHRDGGNLLKILASEIGGEAIYGRKQGHDCGYDPEGKGFDFFKYLIDKGIPFNENHDGFGVSAKDVLNNTAKIVKDSNVEGFKVLVLYVNYLEELENKGHTKKPLTINIDNPVECEILFVGTDMQKELGVITFKNGEESDGYKIGSEKGSWTFKWKLPNSKEAMFDVLNKGANWAYYFDESFKEKWNEELPGVDFDDSEWHGGNGLALDDKIFDINGNEVDEEKIKDYITDHDTESISFSPSYQSEIKIKGNNTNWVSFSLSNNMWKMSTGTDQSGKETTIESELIPEIEFNLVEKIKDILE